MKTLKFGSGEKWQARWGAEVWEQHVISIGYKNVPCMVDQRLRQKQQICTKHICTKLAGKIFLRFTLFYLLFGAGIIFLNFSTPCIWNMNNTGTKYVRIMKQTAFWREKNGEYTPCLKYSVPIFAEYIKCE